MKPFFVLLLLMTTCSAFQTKKPHGTALDSKKTLIVYLSRTNNTRAIAEIIQDQMGGDLVALELENPYPEDYDAIVKQVAEENETGFLPPLKTRLALDRYDTIFVGFPTWGMQLPPPMKSFLSGSNLSGKAVIPFNTNAGYGVGSGFKTVKTLCPDSSVLEGFIVEGGIERDGVYLAIKGDRRKEVEGMVKSWLQDLNILETQ
jgi:flavodoxin